LSYISEKALIDRLLRGSAALSYWQIALSAPAGQRGVPGRRRERALKNRSAALTGIE
jgi:hypothetical protein